MTTEQLLDLLMRSPIHRKWPLEGIVRCFWPPLLLGQYRGRVENGRLVFLATWAFLTEEAERGYIEGTRLLQADDWNAGSKLWLVDVIAPGRARDLVREVESVLADGRHDCAYSRKIDPRTGKHRLHRWVSGKRPKEIAA